MGSFLSVENLKMSVFTPSIITNCSVTRYWLLAFTPGVRKFHMSREFYPPPPTLSPMFTSSALSGDPCIAIDRRRFSIYFLLAFAISLSEVMEKGKRYAPGALVLHAWSTLFYTWKAPHYYTSIILYIKVSIIKIRSTR